MNGRATDPPPTADPGPPDKVRKFDQAVRASCVLGLVGAFILAFLWGVFRDKMYIGSDVYLGVLTLALTWWFKSRDEQQRRTDLAPPPGTVTTPATPPAASVPTAVAPGTSEVPKGGPDAPIR